MTSHRDNAWKRASKLAQKPAAVIRVAGRASQRLMAATHRLDKGVIGEFATLTRLAKAWGAGEYRKIPLAGITAIIGALVYFIMPLDAIPDPILGLGLIDDIAVMRYAWRYAKKDIDAFHRWESQQTRVDTAGSTISSEKAPDS